MPDDTDPVSATETLASGVTTHTVDILRVGASFRAEVITTLSDLEGVLISKLESDNLSVNKSAKLSALLQQSQKQIANAYSLISSTMAGNLKELASLESEHTGQQIAKAMNVSASLVSSGLSAKQLEAAVNKPLLFGHSSAEWWAGQAENLRMKFSAQMQQGFLLGEGVDELARRIRGSKDKNYEDGIMPLTKRQAEALVRSSVIAMSNQASIDTIAGMEDIAKGIQWVSTLDSRTTLICKGLDRKVWRLPDFQPVGHAQAWPGATAHWNCRSRQIPVLRSWEELSGKSLPSISDEELLAATQANLVETGMMTADEASKVTLNKNAKQLDGEPAGMKDYGDWLEGKTDAQIDRILGPGRGQLFRSGQATLSDMLDQNNRPLTIEQLKAKIQQGIDPPETLGVPFLPAPKKAGLHFPEPEPPPPAKPTLSPADASAQLKIEAALATKAHQALMNQVLTTHADSSPEAQHAVFESLKLAKEVSTSLNDEAAAKVAAGTTPAKVKTILNKLAPDDPAKIAFGDKVKLALADIDKKAAAEAVHKAFGEFGSKSPAHAAAAAEASSLNHGKITADTLVEAIAILDMNATRQLQKLAAGAAGAGAILKSKAAAILKSKAEPTHDDLLQVQASAAEAVKVAAYTTVQNGLIKNLAEGKPLTAKQKAVYNDLTSDATLAEDLQKKVDAFKSSKQVQAAVSIATGPDLKVQNLAPGVPDTSTFEFLNTLPGSTNPGLYQDGAGKLWVVKKAASTSLAHVESETLADNIYRAAGVKVPFSALTTMGGETVKVAEFLSGGQQLSNAATPALFGKARENFVADALFGNWDAVGTGKNNMLVVGGDVWRIDNGGALEWRAMGAKKDAKWLTPEVQELKSLLNASINGDAAAVYKGITQGEIHAQIADLLSRRTAILDAAAADPAVHALLTKRLDWLAKQLPAGMQQVRPANADAVPKNIEALLVKAGPAGHALALDGPEIEDNNVLVWREKDSGLTDRVKAQLKVTDVGSKIIEARLKDAGADMSGPTAAPSSFSAVNAKAHPSDVVWPELQTAAKHIGAHALPNGDGIFNAAKLAILDNWQAKLTSGGLQAMPGTAEMVLQYKAMVADLKSAVAAKAKPQGPKPGTGTLWEQFELPKPVAKTPAPSAPVAAAGLPGWSIKRSDTWERPTGQVVDGVVILDGGKNPQSTVGRGWEMTKGPVTVRFAARQGGNQSAQRAMFGTVELTVQGSGPAAVNSVLSALGELGIDTKATPDVFKELIYLHKGWYLTGKHNTPAYKKLYDDEAMPIADKVEAIKALSEKTFGVTLPRTRDKWGPDYNPDGRTAATNESGYRFFDRWDIPPAKMEKDMAGWQLHHSSSDPASALRGWLAAGVATSTYDRYRTGVSIGQTGGASSLTDMRTGGGVHFYTNVVKVSNGAAGFRFKVRNLARLDTVSHFGDTFGNYDAYPNRLSQPTDYKQMNRVSISADNGLLKGGLAFVEEIETIIVGSAAKKKEVIQIFKDAGFTKLPDGRSVADIVTVK